MTEAQQHAAADKPVVVKSLDERLAGAVKWADATKAPPSAKDWTALRDRLATLFEDAREMVKDLAKVTADNETKDEMIEHLVSQIGDEETRNYALDVQEWLAAARADIRDIDEVYVEFLDRRSIPGEDHP